MINVLPPHIKDQVSYAKRNAKLIGYVWLLIGVMAVAGGIFAGALMLVKNQTATAEADLKAKESSVATYKKLEDDALELNSRLATIKAIQQGQSRFSALLADLAAYTPKGVFINSINLTGDDKKPVIISGTATSYQEAASFRDAMATSPRISGADIQDISNPAVGVYKVNLVIGFNPGQSK